MTGHMNESLTTVRNSSTVVYEEKRSRFLADVGRVSSEEDASAFLNDIRMRYKDASHCTYAYSVTTGMPANVQRFSDGGEPSGTAGMPILEVIKKRRLTDTIVVVTRYFGGILLGASGLTRAYGKSAALGLDSAGAVTMIPAVSVTVTCGYGDLNLIQSRLGKYPFKVVAIRYAGDTEMDLTIPCDSRGMFRDLMNTLTGGQATVVFKKESFEIF